MGEKYNPASDPMNGPNRLALRRTPEAREYDATDWPGSSSFHPVHLRDVFLDLVPEEDDVSTEIDIQNTEEE